MKEIWDKLISVNVVIYVQIVVNVLNVLHDIISAYF